MQTLVYENVIKEYKHGSDFTFAHREEGFDEHIENSIRGYSNLINDVVSFSRYFVEDGTNIIDIGCSTGKMTKLILLITI